MSFILRVRTSQGMHRLTFSSSNASYKELQNAIENKYGISSDAQVLSLTPLHNPKFIENATNTTTLNEIGLKHGDMIYLALATNQIDDFNKIKKEKENTEHKLTDKDNEEKDEYKNNDNDNNQQQKPKAKYVLKPLKNRKNEEYAKQVTMTTSKYINAEENKIEDAGAKHVPFHEWIEERQKKFELQPWNIDPPKFDYKPRPYKNRIDQKNLPPNAYIKRQEYRHVDLITFKDNSPFNKFRSNWLKDSSVQRCAYLIGRYEKRENNIFKNKNKKNKKNNKKKYSKELMCAKVYALYEPPQKGHGRGIKLLKDPNEENVDIIIKECGMQRIGIVYTTLPRYNIPKYHGDVFMSGPEIFTSSMLQCKYKNANTGYSKFITLITHILEDKETQGFMLSDQCMSMIKNGLIKQGTTSLVDDDKDNYGFMMVNPSPKKTSVPMVINENTQIKENEHFAPDALLVNVIATTSKQQEHIFKYVHFPSIIDKEANIDKVRQHLIYHKSKEFHVSLSDFNLLIFLTKIIDVSLVQIITKHVVANKLMDESIRKKVFAALRIAVPGWA